MEQRGGRRQGLADPAQRAAGRFVLGSGVGYPFQAANGPKMLTLAAEIADVALPILVPPQYTANARQVLGPDKH